MLRCGCLPLEVETVQYQSPRTPLTLGLANYVPLGDEVHFLNGCRPLQQLRVQLYQVAS